jgi:hypothetical protein
MTCKICNREAVGEYCELHERAHRNIVKKYEVWRTASNLSWEEYLNEVAKNPYTGSWVKEVVDYLKKSGMAEGHESN